MNWEINLSILVMKKTAWGCILGIDFMKFTSNNVNFPDQESFLHI